MSFLNDRQAFILANIYGLCPPRQIKDSKRHDSNTGKYEPDHDESSITRTMVLASFHDKTNLLIKYNPAELILQISP